MRRGVATGTLVSGFGWGGPPGQVADAVLSGRKIGAQRATNARKYLAGRTPHR
jgi:hypothetical protein